MDSGNDKETQKVSIMSHVTLPDMAKKADVSVTTVSRALNNNGTIFLDR